MCRISNQQARYCIANKIINVCKCTVEWHVIDLKISHTDENVVSEILKILEEEYGKLQTTRGKVYKYLGMTLDFSEKNKVRIIIRESV